MIYLREEYYLSLCYRPSHPDGSPDPTVKPCVMELFKILNSSLKKNYDGYSGT